MFLLKKPVVNHQAFKKVVSYPPTRTLIDDHAAAVYVSKGREIDFTDTSRFVGAEPAFDSSDRRRDTLLVLHCLDRNRRDLGVDVFEHIFIRFNGIIYLRIDHNPERKSDFSVNVDIDKYYKNLKT